MIMPLYGTFLLVVFSLFVCHNRDMGFPIPSTRAYDYCVSCKGCGEVIPAPVQTLPDSWVIAECFLCGEKRRYLPSEIFQGRLSHKIDYWKLPERRR